MKKWAKRSTVAGITVIGVIVIAFLGMAWYFSNVLYQDALNPTRTAPKNDTRIVSAETGKVVLEGLTPQDQAFARAGYFGLEWDGGYGYISDILDTAGPRRTRAFSLTQGALPAAGTPALIDSTFPPRDGYPAPGLTVSRGTYSSDIGEFEYFGTAGTKKTRVILIHGNGMRVAEVRRFAESFQSIGYPTMAISYRNDPGQPRDPSGILQYGRTEWKDVEGAVRSALQDGADGVVIFGMSMGGGIAVNFMYNSELAGRVKGLVLDAPMLDFGRTVDFNAGFVRLPVVNTPLPLLLVKAAKLISAARFGIRWGPIDYLPKIGSLKTPILLFHGTADTTVPVGTSDLLAAGRKDLIYSYVRTEGVEHCQTWNYDREAYVRSLAEFMAFVEKKKTALALVSSGRVSDSAP